MKNKKIILAGGTGFIGSYMSEYFAADNKVIVLTRKTSQPVNNAYNAKQYQHPNVKYVQWDGRTIGAWAQELESADCVVNLAGKSVNCRYTYSNMKAIFDSRLQTTKLLARAINACANAPAMWVNITSATIYRNAPDRPQDEENGEISTLKAMNGPASSIEDIKAVIYRYIGWLIPALFVKKQKRSKRDFSVRVCQLWEECFYALPTPRTRKICLRTAVTLGNGGAMVPYTNLVKWGLGGRQGNGKQMYSWIHIEDVCRVIEWFHGNQHDGTFNCSAPCPVSNSDFMQTLRKTSGYKFGLPAYKWMLETGACLMGTEPELLLKSRWVLPAKLLNHGFVFKYPALDAAMQNIARAIAVSESRFA